MHTPDILTSKINNSANPDEIKQKIWESCRYLMTVTRPVLDFDETNDEYYKGHKVIPGPRADGDLVAKLDENDLDILENQYFIRFWNNATSDNAGDDIAQGLFGVMDKNEADDYERILREQREQRTKPKGVSS